MKHEKIIKRPDGSRVKIAVEIWRYWRPLDCRCRLYQYLIYTCKPGGRKFIHQAEDWEGIVTPEEIQEAKMELYEKLKP